MYYPPMKIWGSGPHALVGLFDTHSETGLARAIYESVEIAVNRSYVMESACGGVPPCTCYALAPELGKHHCYEGEIFCPEIFLSPWGRNFANVPYIFRNIHEPTAELKREQSHGPSFQECLPCHPAIRPHQAMNPLCTSEMSSRSHGCR